MLQGSRQPGSYNCGGTEYSFEIRWSGFEVELVVFERRRGVADTARHGAHAVPAAAERSGLSETPNHHGINAVVGIHSALDSVSPPLSWLWKVIDLEGLWSQGSLHQLVACDCEERPTCDGDDLEEEPHLASEVSEVICSLPQLQ
jgi:hypothetical protein